VSATDPRTSPPATIVIVVTAAVLPALRAAGVDPVAALKAADRLGDR
jgi:hypothetical protein